MAQQQDAQTAAAQKAALQQQYDQVVEAQSYVSLSVAAILLSYYSIDLQRQQLAAVIEGTADPSVELDLFDLQMVSALMILVAVAYFFGTTQESLETLPEGSPLWQSAQYNNLSNVLVLLAAVIRIYNLLLIQSTPGKLRGQALEEIETDQSVPF